MKLLMIITSAAFLSKVASYNFLCSEEEIHLLEKENYDSVIIDHFNDDVAVEKFLGFLNYSIKPKHVPFVIDTNRIKSLKYCGVRKFYAQVDFVSSPPLILKGCRMMNNQRIVISLLNNLLKSPESCRYFCRNQNFTEQLKDCSVLKNDLKQCNLSETEESELIYLIISFAGFVTVGVLGGLFKVVRGKIMVTNAIINNF